MTTGYALYHLLRPAKGRTPASSASYHFFALVIDIGLIPFYIFTALVAKSKQNIPLDDNTRWTSFFDNQATDKIILSTWLISIVVGGLHLVSSGLSLYLMWMFRKIMNLPPDLNPLEDNLTSRRKSKHKYKNSELSASISEPTLVGSTTSLANSGRASPVKSNAMAEVRPISFMHTRQDSDFSYSPHNPTTAQASRSTLAIPHIPQMYQQPRSTQTSYHDVSLQDHVDARSEAASKRSHGMMSEPSSHSPTFSASSSVYSDAPSIQNSHSHSATSTMTSILPALPRKSSKRYAPLPTEYPYTNDGGAKENKIPQVSIVEEGFEHDAYQSVTRPSRPYDFTHLKNFGRTYQAVPQHQQHDEGRWLAQQSSRESFVPVPLGMNPPTPPLGEADGPGNGARSARSSPRKTRPLSTMSGNSSAHSTPRKTVGAPKSKYYGDLNSAMAGVRGGSPSPSPPKGGNTERRDWAVAQDGGRKGRVVSRSGAYEGRDAGGFLRGRNVSGKVAEEGRGGVGWRAWGR